MLPGALKRRMLRMFYDVGCCCVPFVPDWSMPNSFPRSVETGDSSPIWMCPSLRVVASDDVNHPVFMERVTLVYMCNDYALSLPSCACSMKLQRASMCWLCNTLRRFLIDDGFWVYLRFVCLRLMIPTAEREGE